MLQRNYQRLVEQLAQYIVGQQADLTGSAELASELLCQYLTLANASVWVMAEDWIELSHIANKGKHGSKRFKQRPAQLQDREYYLVTLQCDHFIAVGNTAQDPRLAELQHSYFLPCGINAILDVGIFVNDILKGILCLERCEYGDWSSSEVELADQVAHQLSLAISKPQMDEPLELLSLLQGAIAQSELLLMLVNLQTLTLDFINDGQSLITGVSKDKLLGRPVRQLDCFKRYAELGEQLLAQVIKGQRCHGELAFSRPDGKDVWLKYQASRIMTDQGKPYLLLTCDDRTEQYQYQLELEQMAWRCNLTGLFNRPHFNRVLESCECGLLLLIDLVDFKRFNDTYGHEQGDALLKETAQRLRRFFDAYKTTEIARIGSDEFAVLLPCDDELRPDLDYLIKRLYQLLSMPLSMVCEQVYPKPALAVVDIASVSDLNAPMTCADIALQYAKKKQGMTSQVFNNTMLSAFKADAQIERDLYTAIRGRQFELYYQPLRDLQTNRYTAAEALIRWHHPKKGVLYPGAFIDIAEQSELITSIGNWVLEAACRQLNLWQRQQVAITLHVNVSARQFFSGNLYEQVWLLMARYRLEPRSLILEITETELMEDIRSATNLCQELSELGVGLAIDDFGTGYSSMRYLKQFPISKIKIDRSFIADLTVSHESREIVSAIIAMAEALNLSLTAEGVETKEQEAFLTSKRCHQAQGFLYSPALREADFMRFIGSISPRAVG